MLRELPISMDDEVPGICSQYFATGNKLRPSASLHDGACQKRRNSFLTQVTKKHFCAERLSSLVLFVREKVAIMHWRAKNVNDIVVVTNVIFSKRFPRQQIMWQLYNTRGERLQLMAKLALGGNKKCGPGEICDRKDKKGRKRIQGKFLKKTLIELWSVPYPLSWWDWTIGPLLE